MRRSALTQAVAAAAVTGLLAARRRKPAPAVVASEPLPQFPTQPRSSLELLGLTDVEDVVVAEHEAQDERMFDALEWGSLSA
ncbi:MAG: hypothetical protein JWM40_2104 [Frankiales bacterium]|nr:hypothetical protein [Frankiales bacterium]